MQKKSIVKTELKIKIYCEVKEKEKWISKIKGAAEQRGQKKRQKDGDISTKTKWLKAGHKRISIKFYLTKRHNCDAPRKK